MKYFNVTVMEKGKKRQETVKADNRMAAVNFAKQKFPSTMVMKAVETAAPLEDSLSELFSGLQKSFKSKIPLNDKISTIRQIAVMTDAGIPINDTLVEVSENTENKQLKEIYAKINSD
ncbi:MAG: type II secretion system F family protein, partial [Sulfurovum sp.]